VAAVNASLDHSRAPVHKVHRLKPLTGGNLRPRIAARPTRRPGGARCEQAELFVLRFFEGYSNGEIVELTGMNKPLQDCNASGRGCRN
jgi:hypothetical protein